MNSPRYQMTLQQMFPEMVAELAAMGVENLAFTGLTQDSRKVVAGDLFLACQGASSNGVDFVEGAIEKGAVAVLINDHQQLEACGVAVIKVAGLEQRLAEFGSRFYQQPSANMDVVGITGTNGKTSCSHFMAQALNLLSRPAAVIGTNGYGLLENLNRASHTTPDALYLQSLLADMQNQDAKVVVMEVSSHALDQQRVEGVKFKQVVFTNLTRDHLDYHGDMESYGEAKKALFTDFGANQAVINLDDDFAKGLVAAIPKGVDILGYSLSGVGDFDSLPQIYALEQRLSSNGIVATLHSPIGNISFHSKILGEFNLSNLMACAAVLIHMEFSAEQISSVLGQLHGVDGRMELVADIDQKLMVIDYAHTPDALEKALGSLRNHCHAALWCVFGCGGDRDRGKRAEMAAVAERYADYQIVTSDNPRSENPDSIIEEIVSGFCRKENLLVEQDRTSAIATALEQSQPGDVILVAGKGHEDYQEIDGIRHHYSDREVISNLSVQHGGVR